MPDSNLIGYVITITWPLYCLLVLPIQFRCPHPFHNTMCWLNTTYGGCEAGIRMSTPMTTPLIVYSPVPFSNTCDDSFIVLGITSVFCVLKFLFVFLLFLLFLFMHTCTFSTALS